MNSNYEKILGLTLGLILIAGIVSPAVAQEAKDAAIPANTLLVTNTVPDHTEAGDAGSLPATAHDVGGTGTLDSISGIAGSTDVDMYRICITDFTAFSATTESMADFDTQLFLFDSNGLGIYSNDDTAGAPGLFSTLPAGDPNSPTANGEYFLAISTFNNEPQGVGGDIFTDIGFEVVQAPTGAGGPGPITGWDSEGAPAPANYIIGLTGAAGLDQCSAVGGESLPIDASALLIAGASANAVWILPVLAGLAGAGIYITKSRLDWI